jgi:hypothetical protein
MTTNLFGVPIQGWFQSATGAAITNTLPQSILPQAGAGYRWVITDLAAINVAASVDTIVQILGTNEALLWNLKASRGAGESGGMSLKTPIVTAENSHVYAKAVTTSSSTVISISGFKDRIPST